MIRWTELGRAAAPGGGELRLMQRGSEFSIMIGPDELMNSRRTGSEAALATLACQRLDGRQSPHLLIGGLGMGFTLRAALAELGAQATVTVAELVPEVVSWAQAPLAEVFQGSLEDPRVRIVQADVRALIADASCAYDAILLDVDNGPGGLVQSDNDGLYDAAGLHAAHRALKPAGMLAVWSAAPSDPFVKRLRQAGFNVEEVAARSGGGRRGAKHVIWIATARGRN